MTAAILTALAFVVLAFQFPAWCGLFAALAAATPIAAGAMWCVERARRWV